jgi:UDP-glucose 4-epimerase
VLVTGAAGYVGRLLVAALAERPEVAHLVALDVCDVPASERVEGVRYVKLSVCDRAVSDLVQSDAISCVVHMASIVRPPKHGGDDLAYRVDVEGTQNVLDACLAHGVRKLIVTSSGAAYGYHADSPDWLSEEDPVRGNPEFAYSYHKRVIEEMLARARKEHPELQQLVFRPGTVLGESVHSPVTDLFEKPVMLGVRGYPSPFVFIWDEDVVECLVRGVTGPQTGVYNLAGDGAMTPKEIARALRKPFVPVPPALLSAALFVLEKLGKSPYGPEQLKFLQFRPVLSNTRLKQDFGYAPRFSSRQAFERYARSQKHA